MIELKRLMHEKNFSIQDVCRITGYRSRMIDYFISGERETPRIVMDAVNLEPASESDKITRGELLDLIKELDMKAERIATLLKRHVERVKKMADPELNHNQRIAIRKKEVEILKNA